MLLRPVPMVHMQVQVANRDAAAVTHGIASQGLLHLVDIANGHIRSTASIPAAQPLLASFRELATRIRRTADRAGLTLPDLRGDIGAPPADFAAERRVLEAALAPIEQGIGDLWARLGEARESLRRINCTSDRIERLEGAGVPLDRLSTLRFLRLRFGSVPAAAANEIVAFATPVPVAAIPLAAGGDRTLLAIATTSATTTQVDAALGLVPFETADPPAPLASPGEIRVARQQLERTITTLSVELDTLRQQVQTALLELWQRTELAAVLLQALTHFATTGRFVVISGWVPADQAQALADRIVEVSHGHAIVTIERAEDSPEVATRRLRIPILHRNPILLRPFEGLLQMYGTPAYREVQPTAFFAVSFLLMFGLMFGDIGHGAVLFFAGYCLFRWLPRFLDYGILLMEAGTASALFGALYGSFFGIEGLLPVLWLEPVRDLPRFMMIAAGLGAVLISVGFLLNVINSWRAGERSEAVFGRRGLFGAFLYWTVLGLVVRAAKPASWTMPAAALTALAVTSIALIMLKRPLLRLLQRAGPVEARPGRHGPAWLAALEGSVELVDTIVTFFANTVSFVRVAAFAAVHAGVFVAMFALADTLAEVRFGTALAAVVLVAGNVLMILLEGLTVSVQVLRLEYYEFLGKFFRGGGEPYRPFVLRSGEES